MSRRAFFARVAGRSEEAGPPGSRVGGREGEEAAFTFHVASFPYHDGPVLVPGLRAGQEYRLVPDPTDLAAVRIDHNRDVLGYVPAPFAGEIRALLDAGEELRCSATRVDPAAELARVLEVRVTRVSPAEDASAADADGDG